MADRIALVDDDQNILTSVALALESEGFEVDSYSDSEVALAGITRQKVDLAVLDIKMPRMDGIELLQKLRNQSQLPVIFLTSKDDELDEALGLGMGADDYITKPFSPRELIARIRAILRRTRPMLTGAILSYADISLDTRAHKVFRNNQAIKLGPTEFRLLRHFLEHPGRVFTREQLLDAVWGHDVYVELRTVDVHIRRLRKALNKDGGSELIRTVRSAGYALDSEAL